MLTLVVPVYRNESSLTALLQTIQQLASGVAEGIQVVFVVDGSPDRSYELLRSALPDQPYPSRLLLLSRNFGSFPAIRAGLLAGTGDRFAVMAADLQEPPELVVEMNRLLHADEADVVVGVRSDRDDPLLSRIAAAVFWGLYRRFVLPEVPPGGGRRIRMQSSLPG